MSELPSPGVKGTVHIVEPSPAERSVARRSAEARATMQLFAGAIGLFKNPASHRPVNYTDPTLAVEVVLLADLLLRLVRDIPALDQVKE